MVHDAAVRPLPHLEFQIQLEPVILPGGRQIARIVWVHASELPVLRLPTRPHLVASKIVPTAEVFAVEEQLPTGGGLCGGQGVGFRILRHCVQGRDGK